MLGHLVYTKRPCGSGMKNAFLTASLNARYVCCIWHLVNRINYWHSDCAPAICCIAEWRPAECYKGGLVKLAYRMNVWSFNCSFIQCFIYEYNNNKSGNCYEVWCLTAQRLCRISLKNQFLTARSTQVFVLFYRPTQTTVNYN